MITILLIILAIVLAYVCVSHVVRAVGYRLARGRSFRKLAHRGKVSPEVAASADEVILDRQRRRSARKSHDPAYANLKTKARPKLSAEQVQVLREARREVRDEWLDQMTPGLYHYVIIFTVASIAGLILEMVWMFVSSGRTELRVGLVWGPFSPIYGCGACLLTMVLWRFRTASNLHIFVVSALLGGGLEQTGGMVMENLFHAQSWTYLGLPDAITQWIAWRFLFAWGVLGLVWCRIVMPEVIYRIGEPTNRMQVVFVTIMMAFLVLDVLMTFLCFYRKTERDAGVPAQNAIESYIDWRYNDQFIAGRFQNLVIGEDLEPNK